MDTRQAPTSRSFPKPHRIPILKGVDKEFHVRSWLYHVVPSYPPSSATRLLMGRSVNPEKKDAVENPVAWTYRTAAGGRVFTTTLGHPEDFRVEAFQRLVVNAVHWASGLPVPDAWAGKMNIDVPYRGMRSDGEMKEFSASWHAETTKRQ